MARLKKDPQNQAPPQKAEIKPKSKHGGARPGAGRKRGVVSEIKLNIAQVAREYAPAALQALGEIVVDPMAPHSARVQAANSLLDRAFGKPMSAMEVTGKDGGPIEHAVKARVVVVPPKEVAEVSSRPMQSDDGAQ